MVFRYSVTFAVAEKEALATALLANERLWVTEHDSVTIYNSGVSAASIVPIILLYNVCIISASR